jgi:hypothetical protein
MHKVTLYFPNPEDAAFAAFLIRKSARLGHRLSGAPAGILQDALTRAIRVDGHDGNPFLTPVPPPAPKPRSRAHVKRLKCQDCGSTHDDVRERACPYAADVNNDPGHMVIICDACCQQRADDI